MKSTIKAGIQLRFKWGSFKIFVDYRESVTRLVKEVPGVDTLDDATCTVTANESHHHEERARN